MRSAYFPNIDPECTSGLPNFLLASKGSLIAVCTVLVETCGSEIMERLMPDASMGRVKWVVNNNNRENFVIICEVPGGSGGGGGGRFWWRVYDDRMMMAHARELLVRSQILHDQGKVYGEVLSPFEEASFLLPLFEESSPNDNTSSYSSSDNSFHGDQYGDDSSSSFFSPPSK